MCSSTPAPKKNAPLPLVPKQSYVPNQSGPETHCTCGQGDLLAITRRWSSESRRHSPQYNWSQRRCEAIVAQLGHNMAAGTGSTSQPTNRKRLLELEGGWEHMVCAPLGQAVPWARGGQNPRPLLCSLKEPATIHLNPPIGHLPPKVSPLTPHHSSDHSSTPGEDANPHNAAVTCSREHGLTSSLGPFSSYPPSMSKDQQCFAVGTRGQFLRTATSSPVPWGKKSGGSVLFPFLQ